ncbi:hypothetical protein KDK_78360 [Dictyobacter kobayashii]|uniref:Uncharacterized protein n=1 Tax=Dictyobacter kobayashii TaxID=2014872 RepID=A0A402AY43_9CHLR|nr:hypothetical protein [Dictyobacter kobayashii]GCE24036.1 hypothetical protein KDK_78360 [Dictyobacter kobayashii]
MSNEEYQSLLRRPGADIRARLTHPDGLNQPEQPEIARALHDTPDENLKELLANLGGHDLNTLLEVFAQADQSQDAPTIIFAYTIKGWGLPFAGDVMNHSMHLSHEQVQQLQQAFNISGGAEWEGFAPETAEARWCQQRAERLSRKQLQAAHCYLRRTYPTAWISRILKSSLPRRHWDVSYPSWLTWLASENAL